MRWLMRSSKVRLSVGVATLAIGVGSLAAVHTHKTKESPVSAVLRIAETTRARSLDASAEAGMAIREIQVEGRDRTEVEHLLAALNVREGDPILGVDLVETRARLEALPWVKSAAVARRLPATLRLSIVERAPAAIWQDGAAYRLVDIDGVVIPVDVEPFADLPVVAGPNAPKHVAELLALLDAHPSVARRLTAAAWVSDRRWNLHLTIDAQTPSSVVVRLPDTEPSQALSRLERLETEHALLQRAVDMIDLRFADRLVLGAPQAPTEPALDGAAPVNGDVNDIKTKLPALKGERKA